jgi:GNAT superfamily N-acetyltransferase
MEIRLADVRDCEVVANLVYRLITELSAPQSSDVSAHVCLETACELLRGPAVWALLAESTDGDAVGVLTLNECCAIYAGGRFGEISELFVQPAFRSQGVGESLIRAAVDFGKSRGWKRLEVCAPPVPEWKRTVAFYRRTGFTQLGPRLKLSLEVANASQ